MLVQKSLSSLFRYCTAICAVGKVVGRYKGCRGGVKGLVTYMDEDQSRLAAVSLDRFLRVYSTENPKLLHKVVVIVVVVDVICGVLVLLLMLLLLLFVVMASVPQVFELYPSNYTFFLLSFTGIPEAPTNLCSSQQLFKGKVVKNKNTEQVNNKHMN